MIGKTITYRDDSDRNYRAIVTAEHPITKRGEEPALDLVYVTDEGTPVVRKQVPHYSHKLQATEQHHEDVLKVGEPPTRITQTVMRRQPGEHWRY